MQFGANPNRDGTNRKRLTFSMSLTDCHDNPSESRVRTTSPTRSKTRLFEVVTEPPLSNCTCGWDPFSDDGPACSVLPAEITTSPSIWWARGFQVLERWNLFFFLPDFVSTAERCLCPVWEKQIADANVERWCKLLGDLDQKIGIFGLHLFPKHCCRRVGAQRSNARAGCDLENSSEPRQDNDQTQLHPIEHTRFGDSLDRVSQATQGELVLNIRGSYALLKSWLLVEH